MYPLSVPRLVRKRLAANWKLLVSVFVGMAVATTVAAATPIYIQALEQEAFRARLDEISRGSLDFNVIASGIPMSETAVEGAEQIVAQALDSHVPEALIGSHRYVRSTTHLVGFPDAPLGPPGENGYLVSRGHFHTLSNLESHSRFVEGEMAGDNVRNGPDGVVVEAVVAMPATEAIFCNGGCKIKLNDVVTLAIDTETETRFSARIVGILEPDDLQSEYWNDALLFADPPDFDPVSQPPPRGVRISSIPEPPVPLFITERVMFDVVAKAYPTAFIDPIWFIEIDKAPFEEMTASEALERIDGFEAQVLRNLPGAAVTTSNLRGLIQDLQRRRFFSTVPLLLLLVIMMATLIFFLAMMVSYLAQSRQSDTSLLRTRGIGILRLLRLYTLEGVAMVVVSTALAPFIAAGAVAAAGKLPLFDDITGGGLLPAKLTSVPFAMAAVVGVICLTVYVLPGALGARVGLLIVALRSSRPPKVPFFHRYYIDIGLLALGGLVFWELNSRGQLVSGGLFDDVEVNETLLLAPVFFLLVVALVFMRFFPLLVRFLTGESAFLLHLVAAASVLGLAPTIAWNAFRGTRETGDYGLTVLVLAVGAAYWATNRSDGLLRQLIGLPLQAVLVAAFLRLEPLETGSLTFAPMVGLLTMVPGQIVFLLFRLLARATPVWLSMSLVRMARNPLQYTWLMLLIVLATGLGIVTTTVGGTLEASQRDRILYNLPAHVRVLNAPRFLPNPISLEEFKETQIGSPDVENAALALRTTGSLGPQNLQVLGVESRSFPEVSWYRDDFSSLSLFETMAALLPISTAERVPIPDGAETIRAWIKPTNPYPNLYLWMVLEDSTGAMTTVSLGKTGESGVAKWRLAQTEIPTGLEPPLHLAAVQIQEPGTQSLALANSSGLSVRSLALTSQSGYRPEDNDQVRGAILLDNIHVTGVPGYREYVVEDFEDALAWTPIVTSELGYDKESAIQAGYVPDTIETQTSDVHDGQSAGILWFGNTRNRNVRGFYLSLSDGPLPVVISSPLGASAGLTVGDVATASIAGRLTPVVVRGIVDRFPTLQGAFILADLDILIGYLNLFGVPSSVASNELYIRRSDPSLGADGILDEVRPGLFRVEDGTAMLASLAQNPFTAAGWMGAAGVSLAVVLLSGGFGYVTYLLLISKRSRGEMGFLRSLGLSRIQMVGLLGFEHLAIIAVGLGLGTWAGLQMSRLTVSPLAVTETGEPVVPPFVLQMDWSLMLPTYAALIVVFVGSLLILNRNVGRLDLMAIQRMSEA